MQGKVGLGLSGGGFRASLYHIGTLAKLAELDVLRHVEVLSCVSGGSIVGAHYYLLLRKKMMAKFDESYKYMHSAEKAELTLSQKDYLEIVEELTAQFMAGVQKNLRMRILSSWKNLRIFLDRKYTRSNRIGELYEEFLYKKIFTDEDSTRCYDERVLLMQNLKIVPRGAQTFNPKPTIGTASTRCRCWCSTLPPLILGTTGNLPLPGWASHQAISFKAWTASPGSAECITMRHLLRITITSGWEQRSAHLPVFPRCSSRCTCPDFTLVWICAWRMEVCTTIRAYPV
ncbi:MAG: hypothetical protein IPH31_21785 [Lewinellaceae bacterium]|nr:hypothetical protein [Lewinellaceae bacterium]